MHVPDFAALVLQLLADKEMSQRALAQEIPVNAGQLSRILTRQRPASKEIAERCDEIFGTGSRLAEAEQQDRTTRESARLAARAATPPANGLPAASGIGALAGRFGPAGFRPGVAVPG